MNKGKIELNSFSNENGVQTYEYSVEQNDGSTSVEQLLTISNVKGLFKPSWVAKIQLDDFPQMESPNDAANKLADWLERLSSAIRVGDYQSIPVAEFKDISDET